MKTISTPTVAKRVTAIIQPGDTVLFEGDSITNAFRKPEETNNAYKLGAGYALMVAAQLMADRPGDDLTFLNRGWAGHKISDLAERWQDTCLEIKPDVLSLLVGVNDVTRETPLHDFAAAYRSIVELTLGELPSIRLVICEPFMLPSSSVVTEKNLADLPHFQCIIRELAREYGATFVALQSVFDAATKSAPAEYWSYDGIHPTAPGFALIARAWLNAVSF